MVKLLSINEYDEDEYALEDAYHDWKEAEYNGTDPDELEALQKRYHEKFREVSSKS